MFQMHPTQVKQIHLVSLPNKKEDKGMNRFCSKREISKFLSNPIRESFE